MDKTLERIFSLLPHKENGKILHGAKTEFARALGYSDGHIVAMWESGTSNSYKQKLSDIALLYGVSVAWLKGETDDPRPDHVMTEFGSMPDVQLIGRASQRLAPKDRESLIKYMRYMFPEAFDDDEGK